ncbi:MAG TPA: PTS glucose transporter subunit IIA, partial [Candidatus Fimousia stercorigallinarum]|nr:PTS glucose transporter subunit IIA [Candidatus Fimousia stercorigallinarum]
AGGIGGAFYGHFNFRKFILGGMGIFELPNMMNPDGTMGNIIIAFIGIAISMAVGFVLTMIFYRDETKADPLPEETEKTVKKGGKIVIASPLSGKTVPLSEIKDEAFSSGALGEGIAVMPEEGAVYAPVDGTISAFFQTGHAIGMTTENGVQLLIHVGMDTVQLEGKGFKPLAAAGDIVKKGQKLLEFDMDFIKKQGYSLVTPVLVANSSEFDQIICEEKNHVQQGETLLTVE